MQNASGSNFAKDAILTHLRGSFPLPSARGVSEPRFVTLSKFFKKGATMGKMDFSDLLGELPGDKRSEVSDIPDLPGVLSESEMAVLLGLTANRVRVITRDGRLVKVAPGRWDVRASLPLYLDRLRTLAARAGAPAAGGDPDALKAEKLRLTRAQADKEETRVARERGELVSADAVSREWAGILRDLRNALLAVPSRCGAGLPHLTSTDIATIDREIRLALEGVAHGN